MNRMKRKILATLLKPRPETKTEQIFRLYPMYLRVIRNRVAP
jgi:hypothetical protein